MATIRRHYSREFKREAVSMVQDTGLSLSQAAQDLGITDKLLHRWRKELTEHGEKAFPGNGVPLEEELARLRRENEVLRREREILKKATIFFAQHYPDGNPSER